MTKQCISYLTSIMCCTLMLSACAPKPQDAIIGKWTLTIDEDGRQVSEKKKAERYWEFLSDGTLVVTDLKRNKTEMMGRYFVIDENRVKIEFTLYRQMLNPTAPMEYFTVIATVSKGKMLIKWPEGSHMENMELEKRG